MRLNELSPEVGSRSERKRVGRGPGSGLGRTAGRGSMVRSHVLEVPYPLVLKVARCPFSVVYRNEVSGHFRVNELPRCDFTN